MGLCFVQPWSKSFLEQSCSLTFSVGLINTIWACAFGVVAQQAPTSTACTITFTVFPTQEWDSWLCFHVSSIDKKLVVAIEGSVEEAKALYKPPEDSQGE